MKTTLATTVKRFALPALVAAALGYSPSQAALTDLAQSPLSSAAGVAVKPNLMFLLDASGSMAWDYLGDHIGFRSGDDTTWDFNCKDDQYGSNYCFRGDPPFFANEHNGTAYNPAVTYPPALKYDGTKMPTPSWNNVDCDPFSSGKDCATVSGDNEYGTGAKLDITSKFP